MDTVDPALLFGRDGFLGAFESTQRAFRELDVPAENVAMTCARLPFLERQLSQGLATDADFSASRIQKLRKILTALANQAERKPASVFRDRLIAACNSSDGGMTALRQRILELQVR